MVTCSITDQRRWARVGLRAWLTRAMPSPIRYLMNLWRRAGTQHPELSVSLDFSNMQFALQLHRLEPRNGADPSMMKATVNTGMVSAWQAAKLIMVTPQWLRQLAAQGCIPSAVRGYYPLVAVVQGYVKFLRDDERRSSKSATVSRMQEAKTAEIELRLAEKKHELIPVEDAQAAIDIIVGKVRAEFSGLPARTTRDMTLHRTLEAETNASLNRITDAVAASAEYFKMGGELPTGGGADAL